MSPTATRTPAHAARPKPKGTLYGPITFHGRPVRPVRFLAALVVLAAVVGATVVGGYRYLEAGSTRAARESVPGTVWPAHGQAAFIRSGDQGMIAGPNQHPAPIASVAKVMTAYLVLRDHPLRQGQQGPSIRLTERDVADTERRRAQQESLVPIAAGEVLTERQALQALLLPSANNIAAVLARWNSGSV
jgi:D-alanyl-D-alanine carboxypeptidase